ncbi:MAG TPA: O-antigen ligase family protein [Nitrospirales bacterium]|nr:O-antigen ligase family protein [Nitrospirales bacterium]
MDTAIRPGIPEAVAAFCIAAILAAIILASKAAIAVGVTLSLMLVAVTFFSPVVGIYILVFSMLLGPEVLVGGLGGVHGAGAIRGVTLRLDDFLLLSVGLGWLALTAMAPQKIASVRTPLNLPIMVYICSCILSTLIGTMTARVAPLNGFFFVLKYFEYFFLFFMTVSIVRDRRQITILVACALITCFLVSLYAIAHIPSTERVSAPFEGEEGEPNTLGGYLVFMIAVVIGFLMTPRSWPNRAGLIVVLIVATVALLATLSRASYLAGIVLLLVLLGIIARRSPFFLTVMLALIMSIPWLMPRAVQERVLFTFLQPREAAQLQVGNVRLDTSTSDRLRSWYRAVEVFQKHPLLGLGITGGGFMDAQYPRVLVESGLMGLFSFLALLGSLYAVGKRMYRAATDPMAQGLALGFILGLVALVVHSIGSNTFIIVRIMEPFWLFAALLICAQRLYPAEPEPAGIPVPRLTPRRAS